MIGSQKKLKPFCPTEGSQVRLVQSLTMHATSSVLWTNKRQRRPSRTPILCPLRRPHRILCRLFVRVFSSILMSGLSWRRWFCRCNTNSIECMTRSRYSMQAVRLAETLHAQSAMQLYGRMHLSSTTGGRSKTTSRNVPWPHERGLRAPWSLTAL